MRKCYLQKFALTLICFCCYALVNRPSAQVIFSQNFEGTNAYNLPTGWSRANFSYSTYQWVASPGLGYNSSYAALGTKGYDPADNWLFSPQVNLQAGKQYILNFWYNTADSSKFRVALATGTAAGQQQLTLFNTWDATNNQYQQFRDTITCENSGAYLVGFQNAATADGDNYATAIMVDDVVFSAYPLATCNSTVDAGTVTSPATICSGVPFNISNTGATIAENIRYAWQRSVDGTNWININNGYSYTASIPVSQQVPTYYRLVDTCLNTGSSHMSNAVLVGMSDHLSCYCSPPPMSCANLKITNISITGTTLNNASTTCSNGYSNFTALPAAIINRGGSAEIQYSLSSIYNNNNHQLAVWIDFNQDGIFGQNEFFKTLLPLSIYSGAIQVPIPADAATGNTRLRIRYARYTPEPALTWQNSCTNNSGVGEYEDYLLNIQDEPACNAVTAGTITGPAAICPNTVFALQVAGATVNGGQMRYALQKSTDGNNWSNIQTAAGPISHILLTQNESASYRYVDTCMATGLSAISNVLTVNASSIFGCYCAPTSTANCTIYGADSVKLNTIDHKPICNPTGYGNYTSLATTLVNGNTYNLTVRLKNSGRVTAYIDFNRNGTLENPYPNNSLERILITGTTAGRVSVNFSVPFNVAPGEALLRIIVSNFETLSGCSLPFTNGQVLDYKINLAAPNPLNNHFSYYVKSNATGANNGSSWSNAFSSLSAALALASKGDTIRIAKGIYKPGTVVTSMFSLKDSLVILGGYPDSGNPTDAERNFSDQPTILSGETGAVGIEDNIHTLLYADGVKGVLVDGLIFERAYSINISATLWGPLYMKNSTMRFKNVVIRNNISISGAPTSALNIVAGSVVSIENCFIENNGIDGWGDFSVINLAQSKLDIVNTVIAKNKSPRVLVSSNSDLSLLNTTVFKNYGFSVLYDTSNLVLRNSIFYGNANNYAFDTSEFKKGIFSAIQLENTITQVYSSGLPGFSGGNPLFRDTASITGPDGKYFTTDDGLRLTNPCSKAINTGNSSFVQGLTGDISGAARVSNNIVDLGAYEVQETIAATPAVTYVNRNASGANNGNSWANAFTDLQHAFNSCSDTIKIAKGIYPVSAADPNASFVMQNNRVVIGGYAGIAAGELPDPVANTTVLDGTMANGEFVHIIVLSNGNNNSARLMNVELKNASAPYLDMGLFSSHAALQVGFNSDPFFDNLKIASYYNQSPHLVKINAYCKPIFRNCSFFNGNDEKGLYVQDSSLPKFLHCYFGKDTTATYPNALKGGMIWITRAKAIIDSSLFYKNGHNAVTVWEGGEAAISATDFIKTNGRSLFVGNGRLIASQCIFKDTMVPRQDYEGHGGTSYHGSNVFASYNDCKFYDAYAEDEGPFSYITAGSHVSFKNCYFTNGRTLRGRSSGFTVKASTLNLHNSVFLNPGQTPVVFKSENGSRLNIVGSTILKRIPGIWQQSQGPSTLGLISSVDSSQLKVYNSLLWRYGDGFPYESLGNDIATPNNNNIALCDIRNSYLFRQTNTTTQQTKVGFDPKLTDLTDEDGPDNIIANADDGLIPCSCSPLLNAGNNALDTATVDIINSSRVFGGSTDIGAYELQQAPDNTKTFYVRETATQGADGKTWATAYNSLQKAVLNNCAETIKITQGTYKPALLSRDSMFSIYRGLHMLGGYPDVAAPEEAQRNAVLYPTILSGDVGIANDTSDNSRNIVWAHSPDSVITLDGFIIENANGSGGTAAVQAIASKKVNIYNCIIRNNHNGSFGGGVYSRGTNIEVNKTILKGNKSDWGAGIRIENSSLTSAIVRNSVFENNSVGSQGGAIDSRGSGSTIENCIFYKNEAFMGGAIYSDNSLLKISNCSFVKNNLTYLQHPGIAVFIWSDFYAYTFYPSCYNSVFRGNTILGATPALQNPDFFWRNGSSDPYTTIPSAGAQYNSWSAAQHAASSTNITAAGNTFVDDEDGDGPDNTWFTTDDGLKLSPCSPLLDAGLNSRIQHLPQDIAGNTRILGTSVDMGAYEGPGDFKVMIQSSDTLLCTVAPVTFTATSNLFNNSNTVYQWYNNNVAVGTNSPTYLLNVPAHHDSVWVTAVNASCALATLVNSDSIQLVVGICEISWTGSVSTEWENPLNWSSGQVPGPASAVIIPAGAPFFPVISANTTVYSLYITGGATVTVGAGIVVNILQP